MTCTGTGIVLKIHKKLRPDFSEIHLSGTDHHSFYFDWRGYFVQDFPCPIFATAGTGELDPTENNKTMNIFCMIRIRIQPELNFKKSEQLKIKT